MKYRQSLQPIRSTGRYTGFSEQKILGNEIAVGTVILEGPIAEFFGVSRAPVKTALAHLIDQGLVKRFEGRGYLVTGGLQTPVARQRTFDPALLESVTAAGRS